MLIDESVLRRIIREEINSIDRSKKKLIVQNDELDELSGYSIDRPAIPGGEGSHDPGMDMGRVYEKDDFDDIRHARFKASGMSDREASAAVRGKLKHRGKRPGHG